MRNGTIIKGGKGTMPDAGNRVPFIVNWPGTIKPGQVKQDIIDFSDIFPTLCEAAGSQIPTDLKIDGRSFLPLLRGDKYSPREWMYMWYSRNGGAKGQEFARDQRFKLYRDNKFYDISKDPLEKNPLRQYENHAKTTTAYDKLSKALKSFENARTIKSTRLPSEEKKKTKNTKKKNP